MKLKIVSLVVLLSLSSACQRSSDDVWNDTKTAGRQVGRGVKTLGGKGGDSRQVQSPEDFAAEEDYNNSNSRPDDFIAFEDEPVTGKLSMSGSQNVPQPRETPGEAGSSIPGIDAFRDPAQDPSLAPIFEHVHFDYNSSMIKNEQNIAILQKIADYMRSHPNVYLFIEGHCDARGPAAYNFALGANRANEIRNVLIRDGISADRLFTVSYGKERLLFLEDGDEFHQLNRRGQFKIWEQN